MRFVPSGGSALYARARPAEQVEYAIDGASEPSQGPKAPRAKDDFLSNARTREFVEISEREGHKGSIAGHVLRHWPVGEKEEIDMIEAFAKERIAT